MAHKRLSRKPMSLKERGRRGLSLFLAMVMTLSLVQIGAFAGSGSHNSNEQIKQTNSGEFLYATFDDETGLQTGTEVTTPTKTTSDGVTLTKRIAGVPNEENTFDITLEVTTSETLEEFTEVGGANVVLVFDVSTSMDDTTDGKSPEQRGWSLSDTRWTALKEAASAFIDSLLPAGNTKNQVSIVIYGGSNPVYPFGSYYSGPNWAVLCDWTTSGIYAKSTYESYAVVCEDYAGYRYTGQGDQHSLRYDYLNDPSTNCGATNCQAGFRGAISQWNDLLISDPTSYADNGKYTIFMSDGAANRSYSNHNGISSDSVVSRTQAEATNLKSVHSGMTLYTIGFGTENLSDYPDYERTTARKVLWDKDTAKNNNLYEYGYYNPAVDQYFSASNSSELKIQFENIVKRIEVATEAWRVTDPISGVMIPDSVTCSEFGTAYLGYDQKTSTINWNLLKDNTFTHRTESTSNGKITYYTYSITYRVKLDSLACSVGSDYLTNGATKLVYALHNSEGELDTEVREAYFNVPQVHALFGSLSFEKAAFEDHDKNINATFTLTHASDCSCGVQSSRSISSSYGTGMVILSNVPSGHTYVLKETDTADDNYLVSDKEYTVNVSWGNANVANPDGKITADNENGYIFDGDLFLNKLDPQSKDLKVTKTWLPSSQGANVTSIALVVKGTITLNDGTTDVVYENTHTITGDLKATEWTATIKDLPTVDQETGKPISYTVSEVPSTSYKLTSGGTVTPDGNNLAVTLTNQITDTKELTIIKDWGGLDERYRTEVTVGLFANHTLKQEIKLNSSNGWSQKVTVDTYSGDEPITYTIAEKDGSKWVTSGTIVLDGTTFTVATDQNSYTITNTPVQQYTESLSGQKTWVDGDDENSTRPDSITVNLMVGTVKVASKTVTSANGWGYSWTGLPKFAVEDARDTTGVLAALKAAGYSMDKSVLTYTVQEEAVSGYTPTQDGNNFTNTISDINECEYVEVTKVWEDDSNSSDTRPDEIVLILSGNGQSYEIPFAKNEFYETDSVTKQTLEPVPKYNTTTGKEIIYTVSEKGVDSSKMKLDGKDVVYSVEYDQNTLTVTNSLDNSSDTVKVRVEKVWMDGANGDKTRPASIDVTVAGETVTLDGTPDQNGEIAAWVAEFTLPRFDDSGKAISYTVSDVSESGDLTAYQTGEVAATSVDGYDFAFTLTNKLVQKYFAIDVSKTWNTSTGITWTGFAAQANKPASVSVTISGDGKTYPLTLNEENGWAASQNSLPKYDSQGAAIAYTVSEVTVNGYNVSGGTLTPVLDANQNPTGDYTVAFANAFNQQFTKVSGQKIWNDGNSTANRPASITVGLYPRGNQTRFPQC